MPMYTYECSEGCGQFDTYNTISNRDDAECNNCGKKAIRIVTTNDFAAKTRYILPPPATRKFGEKDRSVYIRKKWY